MRAQKTTRDNTQRNITITRKRKRRFSWQKVSGASALIQELNMKVGEL